MHVCLAHTSVNLSSYLWEPEESIIATGAVFTASWELQIWVLGTELGSFARAARAVNH